MGPAGRLVTIKRSGVDGPHFPLSLSTCLFGRGIECDIRIQLPVVSKQHCKIEVSGQEAALFNFSSTCPTQVNGAVVTEPVHLKHGDVITIVDRSFRYENESHRNGSESTESPGQKRKQDSLHRVSRSSFSSDPDKIEGTPLKRRRVSFGGRLKPELFDENLPPNTPLKRGETPRRSLISHTPAVLKKIIKEYPQPSRKEDSSEIHLEVCAQDQRKGSPARNLTRTSPVANDTRRRSSKLPSVSRGGASPHPTDTPKRGGRKSGTLPSKRASIDRSQHELLQRIYSRRRSGASEANLIVAKSWADVVKLGAKQTQAKVVKHGPQRQPSKRHKRTTTPKKPVSNVHSQFSTGHANSPCTIIIGKAHIEKVHVPARPYRMLNNLVFNKKIDFNEDLSGLTEMFKTPAKKKPQTMSPCPKAFSNSEDLIGKEFEVPNSGEKPPLCTSVNFGENVLRMTQSKPQEPSDHSPASPPLRRPAIRVNANIEKTPGSEAEPLKAASSANRFGRSTALRNTQMPGPRHSNEEANTDTAENTSGRRVRKTPQRGQKPEGATEEGESCFDTCEKAIKSEGSSEKMVAVRRSRRYSEQRWDPIANLTTLKRQQDTEPKEDLGGIQNLPQTPTHAQEPMDVGNKTTEKCQKSSKPELVGMPARMNIELKTPPQKVDLEEEPSALRKSMQRPGENIPVPGEPEDGDEDIKLFNRTPKQKVHSTENVTGSKRRSRTPKRNAPSLEDLAGLRELFQTPNHTEKLMADDKTTTVPGKSPLADPVSTPMSKRRRLRTPPQKVDLEEEPSALRKSTRTLGERAPSHREPGGGDEDISLSKETPRKKLDHIENMSRSKKGIRTGKEKAQFLEDLVGFKELFQSPEHTREPAALVKSTVTPGRSPLAETVNTAPQRKTHRKMPQGTADSERELAPLGEPIQTPAEATRTHREPGGAEAGVRFFKETPKQKMDPAENVTGSKRRSRTPKRNAPSLEDLAGLRELFQSPERPQHPVTDDKTAVRSKSPLADPVHKPMSRRRRLKTSPQKVDIKQEPSAPRKSTRTRGAKAQSGREAGGPEGDLELLGKPAEQEGPSAENGAGSKRGSRTSKRNAPSLALAGLREHSQTPEHTQDPVTDDKTTPVPGKSPLADAVHKPTSRRRQVKTLPQQADVGRGPSAPRTSTRRRGPSVVSSQEPADSDGDLRCVNDAPKQTLSPAENGMLWKSRRRAPKEKATALEDLAGSPEPEPEPEPCPGPDPSQEAREDAGGVRAAPVHPSGGRQAVSVPQRSLRARRATAQEDGGLRREPVGSGRERGASPPSKREGGTEEGSTGAKRLRSVTPAQDAEEEKLPQKRRRAAPQEGCDAPEPLTVKKRLRVTAEPMRLPGDPPRSSREATPRAREAAGSPPSHQGRSLRSRRPNKTEAEEQRPEPVVTATEKPKTKRSDKKPLKTSQETALQSPEDGAKQAASGGKARGSRMCLRSARPTRMPSPDVAEEKQREKRVGVQEKKQEEEVRQPSDPMRLRSRKITVPPGGKALESEPQQRVTRNAKRCAENIKKDDDNVYIKKLRTRSRRDNGDI
ncbi:proliferation marker protein Ki-67 isoform X2 [Mustela nigripes]|uniref:proliferation marker protein Ki-67 isoform X2 n=1 Tax=Mustela nigripes TaxID=77151 RepID=UPI0028166206|nr:proliferation marker protein Ki-67 isoform X2 [Mustela nigripes]